MDFELLTMTHRQHGNRGHIASRRTVSACALVALALLGCGAEAAPTDTSAATATTTGATAPTTSGATAGAAAPTTGATAPTSTTNTATGATAATKPAGTTAMTPASGMATTPATTPPAMMGVMGAATPPASTGTTPAMPAGNPGAMMDPPAMPATGVELPVEMGTPTLFWLDITGNTVYTAPASGGMQKRFASGSPLSAPDGVAVDSAMGYVYVLNMGTVLGGSNSGSLVRYKLDAGGTAGMGEIIMPAGSKADGQTFNTGKQVSMDKVNRKLYLGDREGSKVWRCDMDGKNLEVLISGHMIQQVVGVAPDPIKKQFYFSDRNGKKLFRANMDMPMGKTHADRDDVELLYVDKAPNAMPLDIELDVKERQMYWTDRQQNTVFTMSMDMPAGMDGNTRTDVKAVKTGLLDVIGLGFDHENKVLYATHSGSVSSFKTDGTDQKSVGTSGVTGIAFTKIK